MQHLTKAILTTSLITLWSFPCLSDELKEAKPVSEEEASAFARELVERISNDDEKWYQQKLDRLAWLNKALPDDGTQSVRDFRAGFMDSGGKQLQHLPDIVSLRTLNNQGQGWVTLLRFLDDESFNYAEFYFSRRGKSSIKIDDVYFFGSGERMSELAVGLLRLQFSDKSKRSFDERLLVMLKAARDGDANSTLKAAESLPDDLRSSKFVILLCLRFSQDISDEEHLKYLKAYIDTFPADPGASFHRVTYHLLLGQHEEYRKAVLALNNRVGGSDGHLLMLVADSFMLQNRSRESLAMALKAHRLEPDMLDPVISVIEAAEALRIDQLTNDCFRTLVYRFEVSPFDIIADYGFSSSLLSDDFQELLLVEPDSQQME